MLQPSAFEKISLG